MTIVLSGLGKNIGKTSIWNSIDYSFSDGNIHAITGSSGSGKSTLLNCIGLVDQATEGDIYFDSEEVNHASSRTRRRKRRDDIGYLFQDYALVDYDTVRNNILFAMPGKGSRSQKHNSIAQALTTVGLEGRDKDKVFQLSGGQKQRVAMARLLVRSTSLILADEPTGALDRGNASMVMELLRDQADKGACVIIATHDPWIVERSDSILDMDAFSAQRNT